MLTVTPSSIAFESGGREITCDAFVPTIGNGERYPAVIGLHGSAGGHATMADPAALLAAKGFAVYVVHYFDRTGTTGVADKQTAVRNFPVWGKTVWDSISHIAERPEVDPQRIGLLGARWARTSRYPCQPSTPCDGSRGVFRRHAPRDEAVHPPTLPS
jgi:dienelactone hydrolase